MENKNQRRELIGKVKSNKMDKSIVVTVSRKVPHPVYKKYEAEHTISNECMRDFLHFLNVNNSQ